MATEKRIQEMNNASAAGIAIWLTMQLAALAIAVGRVALWARAPQDGEQLALPIMIAFQVATSALIFPHLLSNLRATTLAVASAWTMGSLAMFLADAPFTALVRGELYVSVWLIALHIWSRVLPTPGLRLLGTAVTAMLSLGGPVLWYLRNDFHQSGEAFQFQSITSFGPLPAAIFQTFSHVNTGSWLQLIVFSLCGASAFTFPFIKSRSSRQVIH
jgi:hypothetical protein